MKNNTNSESFIILLAALLNGIAGIVVDLYAPCLPAIAKQFNVSPTMMQNTIGIAVIGYAFGQIAFGILCDWLGRKSAIAIGLLLFTSASLLGIFSYSIDILMLARVLQGFAAGSAQVVARAILIDKVQGHRFNIGVVYLSVAFALGLILGPYVGSIIQQLLNWRWNFVFYAVYSLILLIIVVANLYETMPKTLAKHPINTFISYKTILSNKEFIAAFIQLGCCFISFTLWNQIGPFIVVHKLNESIRYFGITALCAGIAYLLGTLLNRCLIKHSTFNHRIRFSLCISLLGIIILAISGKHFNVYYLVPGLMLVTLAQGMAFPNVLSKAISLFPDKAGISASLQGAGMLIIGATGLGLVSMVTMQSGLMMSVIYAILLIVFVFIDR